MKSILIDIGHPAHVHLFKHLIFNLRKMECRVVVTSRKKDITESLLDYYGIEHFCLSRAPKQTKWMALELIKRDFSVFRLHRRHRFDLALGTSVSIAHLSALSKVKSFVFEEDDDAVLPLFSSITYPFATKIIVPDCLQYKKWGKKRMVHSSYHELAYLHPDVFTPDETVLNRYQLKPYTYIVMRHSALKAHHDLHQVGLKREINERILDLLKGYSLVSSREDEDTGNIQPWDMHHVLAFSRMVISDSQTMTAEAACLGVPSIRYNSFVGRISYLEELEHRYDLSYGFGPGDEKKMYEKVAELLSEKNYKECWREKKVGMLKDKVNFYQWMNNLILSS
ncbi:MAG: DUF354 domain-containing protein [Candidatus Aminicenantes bacterium]|nr:DUF354 domain-containing protein [Candidatus Aminicenantes bacterium]